MARIEAAPRALSPSARRPARRPSAERWRRQRHFRRRRRDLLVDTVVALAAAITLLSVTAGLGVVALLEVAVVGVLIGSTVAERFVVRRARSSPTPVREARRGRPSDTRSR